MFQADLIILAVTILVARAAENSQKCGPERHKARLATDKYELAEVCQALSEANGLTSQKFGVSTKSQLGVKSAGSLNSVKRRAIEKNSKNEEIAFACGILIGGLVPKGGRESSIPFPAVTEQF